jgi:hypothetical protein
MWHQQDRVTYEQPLSELDSSFLIDPHRFRECRRKQRITTSYPSKCCKQHEAVHARAKRWHPVARHILTTSQATDRTSDLRPQTSGLRLPIQYPLPRPSPCMAALAATFGFSTQALTALTEVRTTRTQLTVSKEEPTTQRSPVDLRYY